MKINISSSYFLITVILLSIANYCLMTKNDKDYNVYKCETKKLQIKGIIDRVNRRSNYATAHIKGRKSSFSLNVEQTKFKKGFKEDYLYSIGDSIIKRANSKEFIIKRDNNIAIYILDCDD